jgi:heat shock protein HtpX
MTATMKRRACGRDFALSARMGVTTLLLCGLYLAALVPPLWLFHHGLLPAKFAFGFDAVVLLLFVLQYRSLDGMALRASHARIVEDAEAPKLHAVLEKLAGLADVPKPRAAVIESEMPNAFTAGRNPERSTIAVTRGLIERLETKEIEAVLAHEISHIANRDGVGRCGFSASRSWCSLAPSTSWGSGSCSRSRAAVSTRLTGALCSS